MNSLVTDRNLTMLTTKFTGGEAVHAGKIMPQTQREPFFPSRLSHFDGIFLSFCQVVYEDVRQVPLGKKNSQKKL